MKTKLINHVCKAVVFSMIAGAIFMHSEFTANAQPKEMKDGTIFDAEYYAERYADVVAVCGTDEDALFQHYIDYGRAENREAVQIPEPNIFDPVFYAKQNPDVVAVYGTGVSDLYQHYLRYGKKEGRKPVASETSALSSAQVATTVQAPNEKSETSAVTKNVQPQNSPINEEVLRRGADVCGWGVIQSQSDWFKFPVEDCFETASGVYVVCKGWVCQMFTNKQEGSYGQHALWYLGQKGEPYGSKWAQEGVHFWKIN